MISEKEARFRSGVHCPKYEYVFVFRKLQRNGTSHCPGVNKYLIVNYTCIPESRGVTLCQDVTTKLNCDAGWVMELADVFWGRRSASYFVTRNFVEKSHLIR